MLFYRYAMDTADTNYRRSLVPISRDELNSSQFFSYRFYTSPNDITSSYRVVSLGYERRNVGHTHGPKVTERFILRYVTSGCVYYNGRPVKAGQFFFSFPNDVCMIECRDSTAELYYIGIIGNGTQELIEETEFDKIPNRIASCEFIDKIPKIFNDPLFTPHNNKDVDYYLLSVFMYLVSLHRPNNMTESSNSHDTRYLYYQKALNYINEYLFEGISASDIADFLHLSPSYLRSIFSQYNKYSLREYLIRSRVKKAADELTMSGVSVKEAANSVGYEDCAQFSKMFKKYLGMTPQEYKAKHKK